MSSSIDGAFVIAGATTVVVVGALVVNGGGGGGADDIGVDVVASGVVGGCPGCSWAKASEPPQTTKAIERTNDEQRMIGAR